jgi:hypothetical protein
MWGAPLVSASAPPLPQRRRTFALRTVLDLQLRLSSLQLGQVDIVVDFGAKKAHYVLIETYLERPFKFNMLPRPNRVPPNKCAEKFA